MVCADHSLFCAASYWLRKEKMYLKTKHSSYKDEPVEVFKRKQHDLDTSQNIIRNACCVQEHILCASCKLAHRVAKCKKAHTHTDDLALSSAVSVTRKFLGAKLLMSQDTKQKTVTRIKANDDYALQIDRCI